LTGNVVIDLAISAIGIALIVAIAWSAFRPVELLLSEEKAAARLAFDEPDFNPVEWILSEKQDAALARNQNEEIALVLVHGDRLASRRFPPGAAPTHYENGSLMLNRADHTTRSAAFSLMADNATLWLGK